MWKDTLGYIVFWVDVLQVELIMNRNNMSLHVILTEMVGFGLPCVNNNQSVVYSCGGSNVVESWVFLHRWLWGPIPNPEKVIFSPILNTKFTCLAVEASKDELKLKTVSWAYTEYQTLIEYLQGAWGRTFLCCRLIMAAAATMLPETQGIQFTARPALRTREGLWSRSGGRPSSLGEYITHTCEYVENTSLGLTLAVSAL